MNNKGIRKAYKSLGDDVTLTRFVKTENSNVGVRKTRQIWLPGTRFEASVKGVSVFTKRVKQPSDKPLVSGHNNVKIGRDVRKGKLFRGYRIFTLSLEERSTCPNSCYHWDTCYGNNMPFAVRNDHRSGELLNKIMGQITKELSIRGRKGMLIRLHALGDFYSVDYVGFWRTVLDTWPNVAIYGYTARLPDSDIGRAIVGLKSIYGRRFSIRWSNHKGSVDRANTLPNELSNPEPDAVICPEQTGKTRACATCAICWGSDKNINFLPH